MNTDDNTPIIEKVDLWDFMTNDDNPTLKRLTAKLLKNPEFHKILDEGGYVDPVK